MLLHLFTYYLWLLLRDNGKIEWLSQRACDSPSQKYLQKIFADSCPMVSFEKRPEVRE
jgi:hypothetical protein